MDGNVLDAITSSEERIREDIHSLRHAFNKVFCNELIFECDRDPAGFRMDGLGSVLGTPTLHSPVAGDRPTLELHRLELLDASAPSGKWERPSRIASDSTAGHRAAFSKRSANSSSFLSTPYASNAMVESTVPRLESFQAGSQPAKSSAPVTRPWRGWPANVQLLPAYAMDEDAIPENIVNLKSMADAAAHRALRLAGPVGLLEGAAPNRMLHMIRPDSERRLAFDVVCLLVLMLDIFYTPFNLTWEEVIPTGAAIGILCCTATFWMTDMALSFCTGYQTAEGKVEMGPAQVAKRYMRTWFTPDFLCILADAVNIVPMIFQGKNSATGNSTAVSRVIRLTKLARCLRVVGMVRLLRVISAVNMFMEAELTEAWRMMVRILQLTATLLWLGHLCACGWYAVGIGAPRGEIGETWLQTVIGLQKEFVFDELSPGYQYVASYHWGLAQLTLGANDINPVNTSERIFTILCNLFGLLFGGTLISILSTTLIDLKEINQERSHKMRVLKDFLLQHQVDMGVRIRIIRQVQERTKKRDGTLVEKDVAALQVLSLTLLRELRYALFAPCLLTHGVFRCWMSVDSESVKQLSSDGVEFLSLLADDELFSSGKAAQAAYYVMDGKGQYKMETQVFAPTCSGVFQRGISPRGANEVEEVDVGAWLCEAAWWCSWLHVGTLTTKVPCSFVAVPPHAVHEASNASVGAIHAITSEYARLFHQQVIQASGGSYMPTDLHVHYSQFSDLIFHMPVDLHIILGMAALEQVIASRANWQLKSRDHLVKMEAEIRTGQSVVLLDKDNVLQRQVALTLLRIEREAADEEALTQIAVYNEVEHSWDASCRVPGMKQSAAETPGQTLQRFLDARMSCCADVIAMNSGWAFMSSQDVERSPTYGMGTTYNKSIFVLPCTEAMLTSLSRFAVQVPGMLTYSSRARSNQTLAEAAATFTGASFNDLGRAVTKIQTTRIKEELTQKLEGIREVYVLHGQHEKGLYAWLDDTTRENLSKHNEVLCNWVGRLEQTLPEDIGGFSSTSRDNTWATGGNFASRNEFESETSSI
mmetsp:Transcript_5420/g.13145  ORF Transcript_5420/g.13145 Transcript_5420/m.13145 type:complete len:1045 (+) Transcript_5420:46-3180(+)